MKRRRRTLRRRRPSTSRKCDRSLAAHEQDWSLCAGAGWLGAVPAISGYFIKGTIDLMVVGIGAVLFGRSLRWYFERDAKLLRNSALIVSVAWTRWILDATSDILIKPDLGYNTLVFNIIVGVLIGIASVLIIVIIHRSSRNFFKESKEEIDDFGEPVEPS